MGIEQTLTFGLRDEYNRKPIAENIIKLLSSEVDVSPLVIDGGWGTGKTEFCQKLINLIDEKNKTEIDDTDEIAKLLDNEKTKIQAVYVDAFKADHADQPLMTLLAAVLSLIPDDKDQKSLKEKALPVLRFGAKTISKGVVSWIVKQDFADVADDLDGVIKNASDELIDKAVSSMLDDHVKADKSIEVLKSALKELTEENPITIFVDELDRCRPDFAISMLESIKHIFDVEGVKFVLVVNALQLKASINQCYGDGVDAQKYLDKFIGFRFSLPSTISIHNESKYVTELHFFKCIGNNKWLKDGLIGKNSKVRDFTRGLINRNEHSLREIETFIKFLNIYHILSDEGFSKPPENEAEAIFKVFGVYLNCFYPNILNVKESHRLDDSSLSKILIGYEISELGEPNDQTICMLVAVSLYIYSSEHDVTHTEGGKYWKPIVTAFLTNSSRMYNCDPHKVIFEVNDIFN